MLFDLRSPGRRMAVKGIYLTLAILLGGGLVLFGVGSGLDGGLFNAISDNQNRVDENTFIERADQLERRTVTAPTAANYAALARARVQAAEYDDQQQAFTEDGIDQLGLADAAWQRHLEKAGDHPDPLVAAVMLRAYGPDALNQPAKGYDAMEIVIDDKGDDATAEQYVQLAYWAYLANNERQAKLAGDKAVSLAPRDDREQIRTLLDSYKQAAQQQQTTTTGSGG